MTEYVSRTLAKESKAELTTNTSRRKVTVSDMVEVKELDKQGNIGATRLYQRDGKGKLDDSTVSALTTDTSTTDDTLMTDEDVYTGLDFRKRAPVEDHHDDCGDDTTSIFIADTDNDINAAEFDWGEALDDDELDWEPTFEQLFDES